MSQKVWPFRADSLKSSALIHSEPTPCERRQAALVLHSAELSSCGFVLPADSEADWL